MIYQKPLLRRAILAAGAVIAAACATVLFAAPANAATTITLNGGVLTINGDAAANGLIAGRTPAGTITLNGSEVLGGAATVTNVLIVRMDGAGGNDNLRFDESNGAMPRGELVGGEGRDNLVGGSQADGLVGGAGIDRIIGGPGDDTVSMGDDSDEFTWNTGDGSDHVDGDAGQDTLLFNNGDAELGGIARVLAEGPRVIISAAGLNSGNFELSTSGFELMKMNNGDVVRVGDLSGTGVSVVRVTFDPHTDGGFDVAEVDGSPGADRIRVAGSPAAGVTVFGMGWTVLITGAEQLSVVGRSGDDLIDATGLAAGTVNLTEFGDLGTVPGNDTLIGTPGNDVLVGGDGNDRFEGRGGNDQFDAVPGEVVIP